MAGKVAGDIEDAANQQQREVMSREVANESLAVLETNRELAILLAAEAASEPFLPLERERPAPVVVRGIATQMDLAGPRRWTYVAEFTGNGQRVITGGRDKVARVWESDRGNMVLELRGHTDGVTGVDVTPDGMRIAQAADTTRPLGCGTRPMGRFVRDQTERVSAAAQFSPDGQQILTVADQRDAVLWDAISGQRLRPFASSYAQLRGASPTPQCELQS